MMFRFGVRTMVPAARTVALCAMAAVCATVALGAPSTRAQTASPDTSAIYLYKGADRTERLVA